MNSVTFDTNVLIYSVDNSDITKQQTADRVIEAIAVKAHPIPLQTLTEFYRAVVRKRILQPSVAAKIVERFLTFPNLIVVSVEDVESAIRHQQVYQVHFFDALLLATAARSGCTTFFSEDLQHNRAYGSITVRNPFLLSSAELDSLLQ